MCSENDYGLLQSHMRPSVRDEHLHGSYYYSLQKHRHQVIMIKTLKPVK